MFPSTIVEKCEEEWVENMKMSRKVQITLGGDISFSFFILRQQPCPGFMVTDKILFQLETSD